MTYTQLKNALLQIESDKRINYNRNSEKPIANVARHDKPEPDVEKFTRCYKRGYSELGCK